MSSEFVRRMKEKAEEAGYSGGGGGTIAKILIEIGLHRWVAGHEFWSFFKPASSQEDIDRVGEELSARLQEAGCADKPQFGLKITIKKDAIGREPFKADLQEFIPAWQEDSFNLILDAVDELGISIGEIFYGRFQYKSNPFSVKKGEMGKTEIDQNGKARFPSIRLPVDRFANEAEARAAAGGSSGTTSTVSPWSETAQKNYPDTSEIENLGDEIREWLEKAKKGIPYSNDAENFPLPNPDTPPTRKAYIAKIYMIEASDIDLLPPPF